MSLNRAGLVLGAMMMAFGALGCSLSLDFDDDCATDGDCVDRGNEFVCIQKLCVLPSPDGTDGQGDDSSDAASDAASDNRATADADGAGPDAARGEVK